MAVLIDTTGIWGLYFSNSKYSKFINFCLKFTILVNSLQRYQKLVNSLYHEFMKNLHSTTELIVPKITFVELIYPVYTAEGINEMQKPGKFLDVSKTAENITILEETLDDVTSALNFCVLHEDLFISEKGNTSLFDAILASIWKRTGLVFYRTGKFVLLSSHGDTETQRGNTLCDFVTLCEHFLYKRSFTQEIWGQV